MSKSINELVFEEMGDRAEWCDLPTELWPKIGKSLDNRIDLLRFRSVCKSWRSSVPSSSPNSPTFPLKIPHPLNPSMDAFLSRATFYRIEPPHETSSSSPKGWLIKVEEQSNSSQSHPMRLLNPLSDRKLLFPPGNSLNLWNLLDYRVIELCKSYKIRRFEVPAAAVINKVVFFPSSCWTKVEDYVACCIYLEGKLGLMKHGDERWTLVDDQNFYYDDVIVYKGQFYVTDRWGTISWVDTSSLKLIQYSPPLCGLGNKKHLVESCGNLYVVDRYYDSEPRRLNYGVCHDQDAAVVDFKVYRLDEEWGTWVDVKNLEDRLFILGGSCSFSVSAKDFAGYQGNCIYFTDLFDVRVYNLDDRSIITTELLPCGSNLFWPPPSWLRIGGHS